MKKFIAVLAIALFVGSLSVPTFAAVSNENGTIMKFDVPPKKAEVKTTDKKSDCSSAVKSDCSSAKKADCNTASLTAEKSDCSSAKKADCNTASLTAEKSDCNSACLTAEKKACDDKDKK